MTQEIQIIEKGAHAKVPEGYELTTPEALMLAETDLIIRDLNSAKTSFELIYRQTQAPTPSPEQVHICEALFRDAVIQFIECFGDHRLDEQVVYRDVVNWLPTIEYFRKLRDGYAAHRFGAARQCAVVVVELDPKIDHFGFSQFRLTLGMPTPAILPEYISFIETAVASAVARAAELTRSVAQTLTTMTAEEVRALPRFEMRTPTDSEIKHSRGQFRSGKAPRSQGARGRSPQKP